MKSCARSPGTIDINTNNVDSKGQKFKRSHRFQCSSRNNLPQQQINSQTFLEGQFKFIDFNNFQQNHYSQSSAICTQDSSKSSFFSDEECASESFSGTLFKHISFSRASPESPPREDIEKYNLKPVSCLQLKYQSIFPTFTHFNRVQSDCLEDLLSTSEPVVVSAPTGCGKTVVFELAIIKQLQEQQSESMKIVQLKLFVLRDSMTGN